MKRKFSPMCTPITPARRWSRTVVRRVSAEPGRLQIDLQGQAFSFVRVVFRSVVGFRVLDERDLNEFWPTYSERNGWLYEVHSGGWLELESSREGFIDDVFLGGRLREFLVVDDQCISVLSPSPPRLVSLGADERGGV